jgi:Tfp pilus assembly protein PilO
MPFPGEVAMNLRNLRKLPRDKRNKLIAVVLGTLLALAGLYFGLIKHQQKNLVSLAEQKVAVQSRRREVLEAVQHTSQIEADLAAAKKALADAEADVASGDLYSWVINTLRDFKAKYKVNIPQFNPIGPTTDVNLLSNFPYKQTTLSVAGTAHFHDLGRFLADLENRFPHIRVLNLSLELNQSPAAEDQETIYFKLDMVTLVKTNPS